MLDMLVRLFDLPDGAPQLKLREQGIEACVPYHKSGYAYAINGGAGALEFFRKRFAATAIDGSERGIYNQLLNYDLSTPS